MNGAAAHLISIGEEIIIMGFELTETPVSPKVILIKDKLNQTFEPLQEEPMSKL